jgi:hypothetical protein
MLDDIAQPKVVGTYGKNVTLPGKSLLESQDLLNIHNVEIPINIRQKRLEFFIIKERVLKEVSYGYST